MSSVLRHGPDPYAVVVGLDCIQGLQSARVLARRKVPVVAIAKSPDYYSCRTNVCEEILFADTGGSELVDLLKEIGPTFEQRPVLFLCQDKNVLVVSRNRDVLEQWYRIPLPDPAVVEMMTDKTTFYEFAEENGFPIPETFFLRSEQDAVDAAEQLTFPCIIKPPFRLRTWSQFTKLKGLLADSPEELIARYEQCRDWADVLIAQRLIPGGDANHYTCNCYFDHDGKPVVTFTSRKLRQWRPKTGQACLSEEAHNPTVEAETIRLFRSVNYRGLGYLEMKQDAGSGEYFIIEPNIGRPTGRAALAEASGVELLYTMYCDATGRSLPEARTQTYGGVKWMHLLRDLQASAYHLRRRELTVSDWWRSVRGPKTFAILSWRDPMPFVSALVRAASVALSPRERQAELD